MKRAGQILYLLVKRWTSKSPKLFEIFQLIAAILVVAGTIILVIPTAPAWLVTLATLWISFFSGWGIASKFTTTDPDLSKK